MKKRALMLVAPLALVAGLAACGGDDDDTPTDGTAATEETAAESTAAESTETTAAETAETTADAGDAAEVTIPELSGDVQDQAVKAVQEMFPKLDEEQITCLMEKGGADFKPEDAMNIISDCNIDVADLTPS